MILPSRSDLSLYIETMTAGQKPKTVVLCGGGVEYLHVALRFIESKEKETKSLGL